MALDESVSVAPTPVFTRIARSSRDTFEFSGGFPSSGDDQRAATDACALLTQCVKMLLLNRLVTVKKTKRRLLSCFSGELFLSVS